MDIPFKFLFLRVPLGERILLVRHLSIAVRSGMSLLESLRMIQKQTKSSSLKKILDTVIVDVDNGAFLSTSFEKFKNIFGDLFISVVRVGEASGTLTENLNYLAEEMEKGNALRKKVRSALVYPVIIMGATFGIATMMMVFVFPKVLPVFQSLRIKLPFATIALIAVANFIAKQGFYAVIGLAALIIGFRFLLRVRRARFYFHRALIALPLFGNMVRNVNMANFARTLALLLKSGVKIVEAVSITSDTMANLVYKDELKKAADMVKTGEYLSKYFREKENLFPAILINMIAVGENTGNLSENLVYLAEFYENEVDDFVKNLSSILEPILLLVMGLIVGFIAVAIISPIYRITQSLTL